MKKFIWIIVFSLLTSFVQAKEIPSLGVNFSTLPQNNATSAFPCFGDEIYGLSLQKTHKDNTLSLQTNLKIGDVIFAIDKYTIFHPIFIPLILEKHNVGDRVELHYIMKEDLISGECKENKVTVNLLSRQVPDDFQTYDTIYRPYLKNINFQEPESVKTFFLKQIPEYQENLGIKIDIDSMIKVLSQDYNLKPWSKVFFIILSEWFAAKYPIVSGDNIFADNKDAPIDPLAERWAEQNPWFGSIEEMTAYSFEIHRKLISENYNPVSIKYYVEIDKRMRAKFPNNFQNDSTPFIEAGVKTSFKQMAKKMGSKKFDYMKAIKYWREKNFEKLFLEDQLGAYEGVAQSTGNYAYAYCKGQGVKKNLEACLFWNKVAVYLDDVFAMETLAWIYKYNKVDNLYLPTEGKAERLIESQQLCEKATHKRSVFCMIMLGDYKSRDSNIYKINFLTPSLGQESPPSIKISVKLTFGIP
ncbi:hypothetical protein OAJ30_02985 [Alphaproteobacteria bacterium]|nr:hypothetical protein [Alphaproteobacteria bacterium]